MNVAKLLKKSLFDTQAHGTQKARSNECAGLSQNNFGT
jgi:hypothetical protein